MNFTNVMELLKNASLFDLYRIKVAIENEIENPDRIKALRQRFAIEDRISYFNQKTNSLCEAAVIEKNIKYVVVKNITDGEVWRVPYCMINVSGTDSDIHVQASEKLTKNHLKVGDLVGFIHEGKQQIGSVAKLNPKMVRVITGENKRWRVSYGLLFRVLEGHAVMQTTCRLEGTVKKALPPTDTIETE